MTVSDWINNIRWKYFTNNKSGLIFKELIGEFRMAEQMTENKRYTTDNGSNEDVCLVDNVTGKEFESDFDEIVDLLNEQEETIRELKKYIPRVLFVLGYSQLPKNTRLSDEEIEAISKLQDFIGEKIVDLEKKCKKN